MASCVAVSDAWDLGAAYESYVGRWSRPVAAEFLPDGSIPLTARAWAVRGTVGMPARPLGGDEG